MNPLKDYPYLFANRKFKVRIETDNEYVVHKINGIWLYGTISNYPNKCTLIARPIEDMTDEEVINHQHEVWQDGDFIEDHTCAIKQRARKGHMDFDEVMNLLSIGVYPFDQNHFDDGTVIDINKL